MEKLSKKGRAENLFFFDGVPAQRKKVFRLSKKENPPPFPKTIFKGDITMKERREFSSQEKLEIVIEGLSNESTISEMCRRRGISTTQFYTWRDQLKSRSQEIFNNKRGRKDQKDERHKAEVDRLTNVIAEISAENVELKKKTWKPFWTK
jgi:transposase